MPTTELACTWSTVRLIRDIRLSGRVRVLMTSLINGQSYLAASFVLHNYYLCWRGEEAFKRPKHRLRLGALRTQTTWHCSRISAQKSSLTACARCSMSLIRRTLMNVAVVLIACTRWKHSSQFSVDAFCVSGAVWITTSPGRLR